MGDKNKNIAKIVSQTYTKSILVDAASSLF